LRIRRLAANALSVSQETVLEVKSAEDLAALPRDDAARRLYRYWCERRAAKSFPSRDDVDPLDFTYAIGHVSLIEVLHAPLRFRYRLVSTSLTEHLGYEMTGKFIDDIPEPELRIFTRDFYTKAVDLAAPLYESGEFVRDGRCWRHETLVLPLSADSRTINMLLIYRKTDRPTAVSPDPPPPGWIAR
jgi:hypothetical protein